jgi:hypothetical protein
VDWKKIIEVMGLLPLEMEGGWYRETYRSSQATAIYYMLTAGTFSAMHKLKSDELWHFYIGDPVRILVLDEDAGASAVTLGTDLPAGQRPQVIVPGGAWQGARLIEGGEGALMGTTMSPGFEQSGFELASRDELIERFPLQREMIESLTRT